MKKVSRLVILVIATFTLAFNVQQLPSRSQTAQAASYVYVTKTGKHYFYKRHDRGLNRAKKVYRVSLTTAKRRGLTLSATEKAPKKKAKKRVVKKRVVHKRKGVAKKKKVTKKKAVHKVIKKVPAKKAKAASTSKLSTLKYHGTQTVIVNKDRPSFSKATLSTRKGAWQKYSNLDGENRATDANAMLNKRLMPKGKRQALYVDPTGWHNKKIRSGWLYNRCHLIGYQLTGQNNNWQNLITGTRSLNDPQMTKYENETAKYLRGSSHRYVRYEVKPIYKSSDLLANGVEMRAQSIGFNRIHYNVYIFNVQKGVKLNYVNGTSKAA
ncbi:DNA-entry nuclease (Competence-specific nuclease) [Pediococcus damnosus]|nr:DNA-entry nuclease (Competence-specific nuclease) [Pediococcus damnosus]